MKAVLYIAVGAGIVYGLVVALSSQALHLSKVEVLGNVRVPAQQIVDAAHVKSGINLLRLSTRKVQIDVSRIPWIDSVQVERIIPSKIRITVKERTAAATVVVTGRSFLTDEDGIVLEEGGGSGLQIEDMPIALPVPGQRVTFPAFKDSLTISRHLPSSISSHVEKVDAPSLDRLTLFLDDGTSILYGAAEDLDAKNYAVISLIHRAQADGRQIASIDVRVPSRPALRPR